MSFSGFHHRNLCISSRTLSVYGLLSLTLSNIWATAMPTFDTIYQRGILAGIFEFSFFLFEAGQCCLWALIHEALAKMLRFYGMEQSFTSLESTKSIAEDVGRASWFKACDISALLVIWYPEGHEVLLHESFIALPSWRDVSQRVSSFFLSLEPISLFWRWSVVFSRDDR